MPRDHTDLAERIKAITTIVLDVDGVMTDGSIYIGPSGEEFKKFHVHDGMGLLLAQKAGLRVLIATGKYTHMVKRRADDLGIESFAVGTFEKLDDLAAELAARALVFEEIAYMGDDVTDIDVLKAAGVRIVPTSAVVEVHRYADYITSHRAGNGAVREAMDWLLKERTAHA